MTDTAPPLIEGTTIRIGDRTLIVPPLCIGPFRRLAPHLEALKTDPANPEHIEAVVIAAHSAIARNHPEVTLQHLDDSLDLESLQRVVAAMLAMPVIVKREG